MAATLVGARKRTLDLSGSPELRFMVFVKNMLIVFIKWDFPTPVSPVINNLKRSYGNFFVRIHSFDFFLLQSRTAFNILPCCVIKDKIK